MRIKASFPNGRIARPGESLSGPRSPANRSAGVTAKNSALIAQLRNDRVEFARRSTLHPTAASTAATGSAPERGAAA